MGVNREIHGITLQSLWRSETATYISWVFKASSSFTLTNTHTRGVTLCCSIINLMHGKDFRSFYPLLVVASLASFLNLRAYECKESETLRRKKRQVRAAAALHRGGE